MRVINANAVMAITQRPGRDILNSLKLKIMGTYLRDATLIYEWALNDKGCV